MKLAVCVKAGLLAEGTRSEFLKNEDRASGATACCKTPVYLYLRLASRGFNVVHPTGVKYRTSEEDRYSLR